MEEKSQDIVPGASEEEYPHIESLQDIKSLYIDGRLASFLEADDFQLGMGSIELQRNDTHRQQGHQCRMHSMLMKLQDGLWGVRVGSRRAGARIYGLSTALTLARYNPLCFYYNKPMKKLCMISPNEYAQNSKIRDPHLWFSARMSRTLSGRLLVTTTTSRPGDTWMVEHYNMAAKVSLLNGPALEPFAESCRDFWHWVRDSESTTVENSTATDWVGRWVDTEHRQDSDIISRLNGIVPITSSPGSDVHVLHTDPLVRFISIGTKVLNVGMEETKLEDNTSVYHADAGPLKSGGHYGSTSMCVGECVDGRCSWCMEAMHKYSDGTNVNGVASVMNSRTLNITMQMYLTVAHRGEDGEDTMRTIELNVPQSINVQLPIPSRNGAIAMRTTEYMIPSLHAPRSAMWRHPNAKVSQRCGTLRLRKSYSHGSLQVCLIRLGHGELIVTIDPSDTSKKDKNTSSKKKKKKKFDKDGRRVKWTPSAASASSRKRTDGEVPTSKEKPWLPPRVPVRLSLDVFIVCMASDWKLNENVRERLRRFGELALLDQRTIEQMCAKHEADQNITYTLARKLWTESTCPAGVDQDAVQVHIRSPPDKNKGKRKEEKKDEKRSKKSPDVFTYQNQTGSFVPPYMRFYHADFRHGVSSGDHIIQENIQATLQWTAMACRVMNKQDILRGDNASMSLSLTPYHTWVQQLMQSPVSLSRALGRILDFNKLVGIQTLVAKKQSKQASGVSNPSLMAASSDDGVQPYTGVRYTKSPEEFLAFVADEIFTAFNRDSICNIERATEPEGLEAYVLDSKLSIKQRSAERGVYSPDVLRSGRSSAELCIMGAIQPAIGPARVELRKQLHRSHHFVSSDTPYNKSEANEIASVSVGCIMSKVCTLVDAAMAMMSSHVHKMNHGAEFPNEVGLVQIQRDFVPGLYLADPILIMTSTGCTGWIYPHQVNAVVAWLERENHRDNGHATIHLHRLSSGKPSVLWVCTEPGRLLRFALHVDTKLDAAVTMEQKLDTAIGAHLKDAAMNRAAQLFGVDPDQNIVEQQVRTPAVGYWDLVKHIRARQLELVRQGDASWVSLVHSEAGLLQEALEMDASVQQQHGTHLVLMSTGVLGLKQTRLHDSVQALQCVPPERMVVGPHASNADPMRATTFVTLHPLGDESRKCIDRQLRYTWNPIDLYASGGLQGAWDMSRPRCVSIMGHDGLPEKEDNGQDALSGYRPVSARGTLVVTTYPLVGRSPSLPMTTHTFSHKGNANDVAVVVPLASDIMQDRLDRNSSNMYTASMDHTKNAFDMIIYPTRIGKRTVAQLAENCDLTQIADTSKSYALISVGSFVRYRAPVGSFEAFQNSQRDPEKYIDVVFADFPTTNAHYLVVTQVVATYQPSIGSKKKILDYMVISLQRTNHSNVWLNMGLHGFRMTPSSTTPGELSPKTTREDITGEIVSMDVIAVEKESSKQRAFLNISPLDVAINTRTQPDLRITKSIKQPSLPQMIWVKLQVGFPNHMLNIPLTYKITDGEEGFGSVTFTHKRVGNLLEYGPVDYVWLTPDDDVGRRSICENGRNTVKIIAPSNPNKDPHWANHITNGLRIRLDIRTKTFKFTAVTLQCQIPQSWNGLRVVTAKWDGLGQTAEVTLRHTWQYVIVKCVRLENIGTVVAARVFGASTYKTGGYLSLGCTQISIGTNMYAIPQSCVGWYTCNYEQYDKVPATSDDEWTNDGHMVLTVFSYSRHNPTQPETMLATLQKAGFAKTSTSPPGRSMQSEMGAHTKDIRIMFIREMSTQRLSRKLSDIAVANKMYPCNPDNYTIIDRRAFAKSSQLCVTPAMVVTGASSTKRGLVLRAGVPDHIRIQIPTEYGIYSGKLRHPVEGSIRMYTQLSSPSEEPASSSKLDSIRAQDEIPYTGKLQCTQTTLYMGKMRQGFGRSAARTVNICSTCKVLGSLSAIEAQGMSTGVTFCQICGKNEVSRISIDAPYKVFASNSPGLDLSVDW
jgi:hypothetical protein